MAIDWLVQGYNIELRGKKIGIVGNGRLVGAPLAKLWRGAEHNVAVFDEHSANMMQDLQSCDVIVSAVGVPGLITAASVAPGAVVIDAATSAEHGKILGDVAEDVRRRDDVTMTPEKGGVGPLTVAALFDNVIRAARFAAEDKKQ
jgi:methylenetetrahydrofolate dehydrogenase (NADP+)/methenyltetrahydrofolate cyclohydrolase